MRAFADHLQHCPTCSTDALVRLQMKRENQMAGKRFTPSADFRKRIERTIIAKRRRRIGPAWAYALAAVLIVAAGITIQSLRRSAQSQILSEVADLHVAALASPSPVDVVSSDRHTVKPWFQGKVPFAVNLPELEGTDFVLVGGRMAYLEQAPGAHLIYDLRKHHISVFVFQERALPGGLPGSISSPKEQPFNIESWSAGGLRYFAIGDAGRGDIDRLVELFKGE